MQRFAAWLAAALAALTVGCAGAPSLEGRTATSAFGDTEGTRLGRAIAPLAAAHPGQAGIHALPDARDAFAARVLLAEAAERSLDVQYYIWHGDETGTLLFEALWRAAARGVRVRLLLDDNNTGGLDDTLMAFDAHPNIEVRLYNPLFHRGARLLNYLTDFSRVNSRMHNKSLTADNQATIVGGRNVGNEYFGAGSGVLFTDLDVIAVGPVVREVSSVFDLYWNSGSAYPAALLLDDAGPGSAAALEAKFAAVRAAPAAVAYVDALRRTALIRQLRDGTLPLEWAGARVLFDDPAKTLDSSGRRDILLLSEMLEAVGRPQKSLDLVSPYFVPGDDGTRAFEALAHGGVSVRVLTNSLSATDVSAVHAGYIKRRRRLLEAGVRLYELKPTAEAPKEKEHFTGSSSASLHAKTFAVDGARIFVGSFNFDERSAHLNTEMGLLIDKPEVARRLASALDEDLPGNAYEVRLSGGGDMEWIERTPSGEKRHDSEPGAGFLRRAWVGFLSLLPIDWLL